MSCYYVRTLGGIPRIFAEYVAGGSISDWISTRKLYEGGHEQALERILDIAIQFAWGLDFAHEYEPQHGLIHQDVKPANVMMTADGIAKVTDFGLAKARAVAGEVGVPGGEQSILVSTGGMTLAYRSPEQASRGHLSRKTDIWSWGVSVLEMFVGGLIWERGENAGKVLARYERQDIVIPMMPAEVVNLLDWCFQQRPEDRPATMLDVAAELQMIYAHLAGQPYPREAPKLAEMVADGLNNRALSLLDLGKVEEAKQVWKQALQVDPRHLEATYNQGMVLWRGAELTDDILVQRLETVRANQDNPWQAMYLLALVHEERGDRGTALSLLRDAAQQSSAGTVVQEVQVLLERIQPTAIAPGNCLRIFCEHKKGVSSVSMSADGRWVLSGGEDKTVRLWEVATGNRLQTFEEHKKGVSSVSMSADGRWALSGSLDGIVQLWEVATGKCLRTFKGHKGGVTSIYLSADGHWILSGGGNGVRLWEVATGKCLRTFKGHKGGVTGITSVSLSTDGRWALSGGGDGIWLWEVATGKCLRTISLNAMNSYDQRAFMEDLNAFLEHPDVVGLDIVRALSLSADGRWALSGSMNRTVRLWEVATGRDLRTFRGHKEGVRSVSLSANGRWALSGGENGAVRLWEVATGRCLRTFFMAIAEGRHPLSEENLRTLSEENLRTFYGHVEEAKSVSLSADGRWVLAGGDDGTIWMWEMPHERILVQGGRLSQIRSHTDLLHTKDLAVVLLQQAEDALRNDRFAEALDLVHRARALPGWERSPKSLETWAKLLLHCQKVSFRVEWLIRTFQGHEGWVLSVSLSADGRWALSGGRDGTIRLWEVATGRCLRIFTEHTGTVRSVSLSADGRWALSGGSEGTMRLWEVATGDCLHTFEGSLWAVISVSLSADGRWALSGSDDGIRLWEVATGRCLRTFRVYKEQVTSMCLSADGHWVFSGSLDGIVRLWDVATGDCLRSFKSDGITVTSLSLSADGRWILAGVGRHMRLWEIATGRCLRTFWGHMGNNTHSVSLSTDRRWALSGGDDGTVRLWEVATGDCLHTFTLSEYRRRVFSVSLSADGRWALAGSEDGIRLWELEWELDAHDPVDWDEGASPALETFLTLHIPYAGELPLDREPTEQEIQQALTRRGEPSWHERDFQDLIRQLQYSGYGWLRPEGVQRKLEEMAASWQGPPPLTSTP